MVPGRPLVDAVLLHKETCCSDDHLFNPLDMLLFTTSVHPAQYHVITLFTRECYSLCTQRFCRGSSQILAREPKPPGSWGTLRCKCSQGVQQESSNSPPAMHRAAAVPDVEGWLLS